MTYLDWALADRASPGTGTALMGMTMAKVDLGTPMRLTVSRQAEGPTAVVVITLPTGPETLFLMLTPDDHQRYQGDNAPAEPHGFDAKFVLQAKGQAEDLPFRMVEPAGHLH